MKKDDDKLEAAYCAAYMDFLAKGRPNAAATRRPLNC